MFALFNLLERFFFSIALFSLLFRTHSNFNSIQLSSVCLLRSLCPLYISFHLFRKCCFLCFTFSSTMTITNLSIWRCSSCTRTLCVNVCLSVCVSVCVYICRIYLLFKHSIKIVCIILKAHTKQNDFFLFQVKCFHGRRNLYIHLFI